MSLESQVPESTFLLKNGREWFRLLQDMASRRRVVARENLVAVLAAKAAVKLSKQSSKN